jgi:hypothetical protein
MKKSIARVVLGLIALAYCGFFAGGGWSGASSFKVLAATLPNATGEHKVLVILVNFKDLQTQPYTVAQAQDVAFNTTSNFYRENSYGQTWLTGDVYGWYTMPISSTSCDKSAIATYAQQAAVKAGANLSSYNHLVYAFPQIAACGFSGSSTIGGAPSEEWINTDMISLEVLGHELGHGFGLYHSHSMDCRPYVVGTNCTVTDYGDKFDIMGVSMPEHFDLFQKERLGWVNAGISPPLTTVTASGTYWMDAYETPGTASKGLKVLKSVDPTTGARTWYYLEHRTTYGFDSYLTGYTYVLGGVIVHTGSDDNGDSSYLLDMTPGTLSWYDSTLMPGQSYTDTGAGVTITTLSADNTGAWVQISMNAQPCTRANPTVSVAPAQSGWLVSGTPYSYTLTIKNNDSSGCASSDFSAGASVPSGWSANSAALNLAPGGSASVPVVVTSPAGTSDGSYAVKLSASNAADATRTASASATYAIVSKLNMVDSPGSAKYTRTQKATVTATVTVLGSPIANATVSFSMTKADGSVVTSKAVTAANGVASFVYAFNKRTDPIGTYRIASQTQASGLSGSGSTSFSVTK